MARLVALCGAAVALVLLWLARGSVDAERDDRLPALRDDRLAVFRRAALLRASKRWRQTAAGNSGDGSSVAPRPSSGARATSATSATSAISATSAASAASAASTASTAKCVDHVGPLRPYHVLLTASSGKYQLWQTRLFYFHYVRVRREAGPCSEVGEFTRLLTQPRGAAPDELMPTMRTVVVTELSKAEDLGFVVRLRLT
jgi:hypothetical protein